ncbi:MAG: energy transducer TonB [Bdellovibrionota bacterium]
MRYFRILIALYISFLVHLYVSFLAWLLIPVATPIEAPRNTTYVDLLESPSLPRRPHQPDLDDKTFVRSATAPKDLLTEKENEKRFASEDEQNVIIEQQARASGLTTNRGGGASAAKTPTRAEPSKQTGRKLDFTPDNSLRRMAENEIASLEGDIDVGNVQKEKSNSGRPLDFSRFGSIERGVSTIGESLPDDVKFGDFTALNTDRHLYYTFYSRIEEMIRSRWVNYAKAVVYGVEMGTERVDGRATWVTKLEILLDKQGNFTKAILHESSGVRNLDAAPVQAFRDAQQFPNPPQEMVKDDGSIHIYYAFSVNILPRYAGHRGEEEAPTETQD